ncbi:hypothetical protein P389DRAFT_45095 [Cystobasidium minutum MCA 4210]|uniref:uncharacterized protein n=1 Tax=Cystobasidium minutum MCA 4210 TaxID=1397322 RepID=UPI0034CF51BB|eukprot:jgi/Rhomi1/45095/CE45094_346
MIRPLEAAQPHRQPVHIPSSWQSPMRYDPVDAALVMRQAPPDQQAVTFHASSFTPDPIYRAHYLAQPSGPSQQPAQQLSSYRQRQQDFPQQPAQQYREPTHRLQNRQQQRERQQPRGQPPQVRLTKPPFPPQSHASPLSPTHQNFLRSSSPKESVSVAPVSSVCSRSSTLRRQETEQSAYSQATLPEPYLPAVGKGQHQVQQPSPMVLWDWRPLSVDPVRSRSQDIRSLWLDLEKALMDSPTISVSRPASPADAAQQPSSAGEDHETTYDFTKLEDLWSLAEKKEEVQDVETELKTNLTRPRLVRRDKSADRLDAGRRALASSIIEKSQSIAAAINASPSTVRALDRTVPCLTDKQNGAPAAKHVRISTDEEVIDVPKTNQPAASTRPSKVPKMSASVKRSSRIPVSTKRKASNSNAPSKAMLKHVAWQEQDET